MPLSGKSHDKQEMTCAWDAGKIRQVHAFILVAQLGAGGSRFTLR
jgi:hypothetical protein